MMKKIASTFVLLCCMTSVFAQFEQGVWFMNSSLSGLDLSHSKYEGTRFNLEMAGGGFVDDNFALLISIDGRFADTKFDQTTVAAQARYYFPTSGVYAGLGFGYRRIVQPDLTENLAITTPVLGYAFFLGRHLTIEPSVYYDISLHKLDEFSRFGMRLGFGYYF